MHGTTCVRTQSSKFQQVVPPLIVLCSVTFLRNIRRLFLKNFTTNFLMKGPPDEGPSKVFYLLKTWNPAYAILLSSLINAGLRSHRYYTSCFANFRSISGLVIFSLR